MYKVLFTTILMLILSSSCGEAKKPVEDRGDDNNAALPGSFEKFYRQFHEDSAFQIDHIVWPLQGQPSILDSTYSEGDREHFVWQKKEWNLHRPYNENASFDREFQVISNQLIIEKSRHKDLGLQMERRFAETSAGWQLIYYAAP